MANSRVSARRWIAELVLSGPFLIGFYLGCGAFQATVMKLALPATSVFGWFYLAVFWLPWNLAPVLHYTLPVPDWCFTFR